MTYLNLPLVLIQLSSTNNPAGVRRVALELPTGAFTEQQLLETRNAYGCSLPRGIDQVTLMRLLLQVLEFKHFLVAFDSQVKAGQQILAETFQKVMELCFHIDLDFV